MLRLRLVVLALAIGLAVGCGGDDDGDGGDSLAEAKTRLVDSCHEGNEGDDADLELCRCIADELASEHGYDSAARFDKARKDVDGGDVPSEVQESANACAAK